MMKPDTTIASQIANIYENDSRVDEQNIRIEVTDGHVTISGTVPSFRGRDAARELALMVDGVKGVTNNVRIAYPVPREHDDQRMETSVQTILENDPDIDHADITVSVDNSVVTLSGTTASYYEKVLAEYDAQHVAGVLDVRNSISVVPTEDVADELIGEDISDAFDANFLIDPNNVSVHVENGIVTLTGTVTSRFEHDEAVDIASHVIGVLRVNDHLVVS